MEVLAYSAIGQAGYILIALAIGGTVGYGAAVVYAVVNSLNKALLFLAAGTRGPLVGAAFAIGAFSVVGVPPAAGFLGKLALFKASLTVEPLPASIALVALIFIGGALSFLYVFELYGRVFLKPNETDKKNSPLAARVLVLAVGVLVLAVGVWPEPLLVLANSAGDLLSNGGI